MISTLLLPDAPLGSQHLSIHEYILLVSPESNSNILITLLVVPAELLLIINGYNSRLQARYEKLRAIS